MPKVINPPFTEEDTDHITLCLSHLQRWCWLALRLAISFRPYFVTTWRKPVNGPTMRT